MDVIEDITREKNRKRREREEKEIEINTEKKQKKIETDQNKQGQKVDIQHIEKRYEKIYKKKDIYKIIRTVSIYYSQNLYFSVYSHKFEKVQCSGFCIHQLRKIFQGR